MNNNHSSSQQPEMPLARKKTPMLPYSTREYIQAATGPAAANTQNILTKCNETERRTQNFKVHFLGTLI